MKVFLFLSILSYFSFAQALSNAVPALEADFQSVVFIQSEDRDQNESVPAFCNATLISPRILITAAHCVKGSAALHDNKIDIEVGAYKYVTRPDGKMVRVGYARLIKEIIPVQHFFTKSMTSRIANQGLRASPGPSEDIAVVVLNKSLILPEAFIFHKVISSAELKGIGSGLLNYLPTVVSINPFEEITTDTKRKALLNSLSKTMSGYWESKSNSRVAPGDSGAPLFLRLGAQWRLAGITKGRAETFFSNWDVYGILDTKLCEIASQIPDQEGQTLLCR